MKRTIFVVALLGLATYATASSAQTLKAVKDRGSLICGVSQGLPAFSNPDDKGNWTGFDVDFCRAVAAAVLGDATKVDSLRYRPRIGSSRSRPARSTCCRATPHGHCRVTLLTAISPG